MNPPKLFNSLLAAALVLVSVGLRAQSYTDVYGNYNYKGNLKVADTTFEKRLIVGDCTLDSSALVQFNSTRKGVLVPRLSTAQMDSIINPANGLLVYDSTQGCFFYFDDSVWVGMGACAGAFNAPNTILKQTTSVMYNLSDTEVTGMIIGHTPINIGVLVLDSNSYNKVMFGVGDFTQSIGTANTAAMMGGVKGNNGGSGVAVQPDSAGAYRVVMVSNKNAQEVVSLMDSSTWVLYANDSVQHSLFTAVPGQAAISQKDSAGVENGIRVVNSGVDMVVGNKLISFSNFANTLHRDMVFKVDDSDNAFIDYLHSTKDSFAIAGTLQVQDGTQGTGKVLTSDLSGNASWQTPAGGGFTGFPAAPGHIVIAGTDSLPTSSDEFMVTPPGYGSVCSLFVGGSTRPGVIRLYNHDGNGAFVWFGDGTNSANFIIPNDGSDGTHAGHVLVNDGYGNLSWQPVSGVDTTAWHTGGNTGTRDTAYIGTADNKGLTFKTDNIIFEHVDSLQHFNISTNLDSNSYGIMTTDNMFGFGVKGIFVGDESAGVGFFDVDARPYSLSQHLLIAGDPDATHFMRDDSLIEIKSAGYVEVRGQQGVFLDGTNSPVQINGNAITAFSPTIYNDSISDSSKVHSNMVVGNSYFGGNTLSGGMVVGTNLILGGQGSIVGNTLVGHGFINGEVPGLSENIISSSSHIDSNYLEGEVLMWNLGRGADNSRWSHNYLKNLSENVSLEDVSGQFLENVVWDTITGDYSQIYGITLLGNDSIAYNVLSGTNSGIRNLVMQNSNLSHCKLAITNAGIVASQFYNSNISHVNNQIYNSTFFNISKNFTADSTPWYNMMLINDKVGIGITSKPTADLQVGDVSNTKTFRYVDGNQGFGKVLTSDADGKAKWQTPTISLPATQIAYGMPIGISSNGGFTYDPTHGSFNVTSAYGADTFYMRTSAALLGSGVPGIGLLHRTPDGLSGFLDYNGVGIGDTRNDGQVGFFSSPFNKGAAVVQWFFDSLTRDATLQLVATADSGNNNTLKINNYSGISFYSNYYFPRNHGTANQVLTDDGTGYLSFKLPANHVADSTGYLAPSTGDTVGLLPFKYNIIDTTGSLTNLTFALPSSPVDGEWVEVKMVQSGVSLSYINGSVANSAPTYIGPSDFYIKLVFRAANSTWY